MTPCKECNKKDSENGGYDLKLWYSWMDSKKTAYGYMVVCDTCGDRTDPAKTKKEAWEKWELMNGE
jgi:hypothetical protein